MRVARILYPVTVLGPGKRIAIWVAGCSKRCNGCANPELWDRDSYPELDMNILKQSIEELYDRTGGMVDGITISGGEPFEQPEELLQLVLFLKKRTKDILIFTGKAKEELQQEAVSADILNEIAVLVDGEYREEENYGELLRGSRNQKIYFSCADMEERYEEYQQINKDKHLVETFRTGTGVIAVGIHKKDFQEKLVAALREKDIIQKTGV